MMRKRKKNVYITLISTNTRDWPLYIVVSVFRFFVFLLVDIQFIIYTNSGILLRPRTVRSLSFKFCVALFLHLLIGFHLTRRTS